MNETNDNPNTDESTSAPIEWNADPDAQMRRLEAVLFYSNTPLTTRKISQLAGLEDGTRARTMIRQLNEAYDQRQRAFHVKRVAGGYQLRSRPQFAKWLRRLEHIPRATRLSSPAMETLAVVAYRQPIIKADIEAIRGVSCGEMLRQLLEKGLVRISGRSEELGRPYLYATTRDFLLQFGLDSLDFLPRADRLVGEGLPEWVDTDKNSTDSPESKSDSTSTLHIAEEYEEEFPADDEEE